MISEYKDFCEKEWGLYTTLENLLHAEFSMDLCLLPSQNFLQGHPSEHPLEKVLQHVRLDLAIL